MIKNNNVKDHLMTPIQERLIEKAKTVQENAHSPYSQFPVGAALMTEEGDIFTGCNVENISFGLTTCAERTAIAKMVSDKGSDAKIKVIAVTTKADIPCSPCGSCRQIILEFSTAQTRIIFKSNNEYIEVGIDDLLPYAFKDIA